MAPKEEPDSDEEDQELFEAGKVCFPFPPYSLYFLLELIRLDQNGCEIHEWRRNCVRR
jgi:hypothetical protein